MLINSHIPQKGEAAGRCQVEGKRGPREKILRKCGVGIGKNTRGLLPIF